MRSLSIRSEILEVCVTYHVSSSRCILWYHSYLSAFTGNSLPGRSLGAYLSFLWLLEGVGAHGLTESAWLPFCFSCFGLSSHLKFQILNGPSSHFNGSGFQSYPFLYQQPVVPSLAFAPAPSFVSLGCSGQQGKQSRGQGESPAPWSFVFQHSSLQSQSVTNP